MEAFLKAITFYLPNEKYTNEDINKEHPDWAIDKIMSKTGILNRYISAKDEFVSDMAITVSEKLFKEYSIF